MSGNHVVRATVPDGVYVRLKNVAVEYEGAVSGVVREAIVLGLVILEEEARKYENLDESDYANIRKLIMRTKVQ